MVYGESASITWPPLLLKPTAERGSGEPPTTMDGQNQTPIFSHFFPTFSHFFTHNNGWTESNTRFHIFANCHIFSHIFSPTTMDGQNKTPIFSHFFQIFTFFPTFFHPPQWMDRIRHPFFHIFFQIFTFFPTFSHFFTHHNGWTESNNHFFTGIPLKS